MKFTTFKKVKGENRLTLKCKFRSPGTVHFGVTVPLISVVGFFISL